MTGSVEDEAARLLAAVQDWIARATPDADGTAGAAAGAGHAGHPAGEAAECAWCPLCRVLAVLRTDRPEVSQRLAEAGAAVLAALRTVLDAAPPARPDGPRRAGMQRIDLSGEAD